MTSAFSTPPHHHTHIGSAVHGVKSRAYDHVLCRDLDPPLRERSQLTSTKKRGGGQQKLTRGTAWGRGDGYWSTRQMSVIFDY